MWKFIVGIGIGVGLTFLGGFLFVVNGGVPMAATASPLPLEAYFAHRAIRAAIGNSAKQASPIVANTENLVAGAKIYRTHCVICHGLPNQAESDVAKGMFPDPPELFNPHDMVTDDPVGKIHWIVKNGIRLSGMPAFGKSLKPEQTWQLALLLQNADKLPPEVQAELGSKTPTQAQAQAVPHQPAPRKPKGKDKND